MNSSLLSDRLWPVSDNALARTAVLAVVGSLIVAAAAQINVPMLPVPMTLQSLAVLAIGAAYGARLGALTLALYALEGVVGLPVFAEFKSGFMLASFGYVLGFILAAGLVGWLAERGWDRSGVKMFAAMLLGAAVLYGPGLAWLAVWIGSFAKAIEFGLRPFIAGDAVKAAIAALAFPAAHALMGRR